MTPSQQGMEVDMSRFAFLAVGAVAVVSAFAATASVAPDQPNTAAAPTASSSAAIVNLQFDVHGKKPNRGKEVPAPGRAPPAYSKTTTRSSYARTSPILGGLTFKRS